jgi:hypothetical protein
MEPNTAEISNVDRLKLADLLIDVRNSTASDGPVVIYGFADEREKNASYLAHQRAESVSSYLQSLGVASSRINVDTKIWREDSQVPIDDRNLIEVEFEPTCGPGGCNDPCANPSPKH